MSQSNNNDDNQQEKQKQEQLAKDIEETKANMIAAIDKVLDRQMERIELPPGTSLEEQALEFHRKAAELKRKNFFGFSKK